MSGGASGARAHTATAGLSQATVFSPYTPFQAHSVAHGAQASALFPPGLSPQTSATQAFHDLY